MPQNLWRDLSDKHYKNPYQRYGIGILIKIVKSKVLNKFIISYFLLQSHHRLHVMRMREHIHRRHVGDLVCTVGREDTVEVAREGGGIAAHVDNRPCPDLGDVVAGFRVHTVAWRIDDDEIDLGMLAAYLGEDFFRQTITCREVCYTVGESIRLGIPCRLTYRLDAVDMTTARCKEDTDRPRARIEIERDVSIRREHSEHGLVELLRAARIRLEETSRTDRECPPEKLIMDDWIACYTLTFARDYVRPTSIMQNVYGGNL